MIHLGDHQSSRANKVTVNNGWYLILLDLRVNTDILILGGSPTSSRMRFRPKSASGRRFELCQRTLCLGNALHLPCLRIFVCLGSKSRLGIVLGFTAPPYYQPLLTDILLRSLLCPVALPWDPVTSRGAPDATWGNIDVLAAGAASFNLTRAASSQPLKQAQP